MRSHHREDDTEDQWREEWLQHRETNDATNWLGQSRQQGPTEGLPRVAGRVEDRHGDTEAFGDVVDSDSHSERGTDLQNETCMI